MPQNVFPWVVKTAAVQMLQQTINANPGGASTVTFQVPPGSQVIDLIADTTTAFATAAALAWGFTTSGGELATATITALGHYDLSNIAAASLHTPAIAAKTPSMPIYATLPGAIASGSAVLKVLFTVSGVAAEIEEQAVPAADAAAEEQAQPAAVIPAEASVSAEAEHQPAPHTDPPHHRGGRR